MRTLVIGDIHGGFKALEQVLFRGKITPNDKLIFLGDYIDGWSGSVEVVSFLIELAKQNTCVFLRGNHDDLAHHWLKTGELNETWLQHGGQSSIDAYRKLSEEEIDPHLRFYESLLNYFIDKENRLFVHAGFTNMHGPQQEYSANMVYWDRTLWETAMATDENLSQKDKRFPKRLKLFNEIFIGHTPTTRIDKTQPVNRINVWNIDTGAAFKGPLSMIDVDTKEVFQSDPLWKLYPDENGRN
ncbi:MAG TPA: metallophosphoesterase [Flavobacteriaceae bacterium]|nr:metallophosphoesterase [Flavobacteriaceae bacterium]